MARHPCRPARCTDRRVETVPNPRGYSRQSQSRPQCRKEGELAWPVGQDDAAAWTDLVDRLKEGILTAFDPYVTAREEEIKRSESRGCSSGGTYTHSSC